MSDRVRTATDDRRLQETIPSFSPKVGSATGTRLGAAQRVPPIADWRVTTFSNLNRSLVG